MNKRTIFCFFTFALMLALLPALWLAADTEISIYYTSSLNGNLIGCECKGVPKAGLSTTAAFLRDIEPGPSIIIDLGDFNDARTDQLLSGTITKLYSGLGYELVSLGDQELASGVDFFNSTLSGTNIICNNIKIDGRVLTREPVVIERKGIKIGFAAVIDPSVFYFYSPEIKDRIEVGDPASAAESALAELEKSGSRYNLLLYHGNSEKAKELYNSQDGWDAVLFAHDQVLFEQQEGLRVMASPGEEGNRVGRLTLSFRAKHLNGVANNIRYFKYEVDPEDELVLQAFEEYKKELINNLKNGKK